MREGGCLDNVRAHTILVDRSIGQQNKWSGCGYNENAACHSRLMELVLATLKVKVIGATVAVVAAARKMATRLERLAAAVCE